MDLDAYSGDTLLYFRFSTPAGLLSDIMNSTPCLILLPRCLTSSLAARVLNEVRTLSHKAEQFRTLNLTTTRTWVLRINLASGCAMIIAWYNDDDTTTVGAGGRTRHFKVDQFEEVGERGRGKHAPQMRGHFKM